jgi:cysteinyl-tRNA synthetase
MGKSVGNFSTIHDVMEEYSPKVVRFWLIGTHYRNPISFGEEELIAAARGLERLENAKFNWEHLLKAEPMGGDHSQPELERIEKAISQAEEDFISGMEDDFNTPQALAGLYDLVREINRWIQERDFQLTASAQKLLKKALDSLNTLGGEVLGLFDQTPTEQTVADTEIEKLIADRADAKKNKNWALADKIRDELKNKGVIIEDTPQGVRWRRE